MGRRKFKDGELALYAYNRKSLKDRVVVRILSYSSSFRDYHFEYLQNVPDAYINEYDEDYSISIYLDKLEIKTFTDEEYKEFFV